MQNRPKGDDCFMPELLAPAKRDIIRYAVIAAAGAGLIAASRYMTKRKVNGAERFADALLDVERLRSAALHLDENPSAVLAGCAAYWVGVAGFAAEGIGAPAAEDDPVGYSRTHTHPYTNATSTVLTESYTPDHRLIFAVAVPELGEIRGARQIGALKMSGLAPARPVPDAIQITLKDGYTAQIVAELEVADYVVTGKSRLFGSLTLRDNRDNAGRVNIAFDGGISGTITREAKVIGRFNGTLANGLNYQQNQLEA
jgi:hypothetical protein